MSPLMSNLERVAEALFWAQVAAEELEILGPWAMIREEIKAKYRAMARAAIEAMKGPTPEMVEAGKDTVDQYEGEWLQDRTVVVAFDAMLSASLPTTTST